eukprot:gene10748-21430_t
MGEGSDSDVMEVEPPVSSTATITVPNAAQQPGPQRTAAPVEQTTPKDCMTNKWYDGQLVKAHSLVRAPTLNGQMFMVSKRDAGNEPTMTLDRVPVKLYRDLAPHLAQGGEPDTADVEIMMIRPDNLKATDEHGKPFKVPATKLAKPAGRGSRAGSDGGGGGGGGRKGSGGSGKQKRRKPNEVAELQEEAAKRARTDHPLCPPLDAVGNYHPESYYENPSIQFMPEGTPDQLSAYQRSRRAKVIAKEKEAAAAAAGPMPGNADGHVLVQQPMVIRAQQQQQQLVPQQQQLVAQQQQQQHAARATHAAQSAATAQRAAQKNAALATAAVEAEKILKKREERAKLAAEAAQLAKATAGVVPATSQKGGTEKQLFGSDKKWKRAVDPKNRIYYWHVDTREVVWKLPK